LIISHKASYMANKHVDELIPETGPGPMDLLKRKGKPRQRASTRPDSAVREPDTGWQWGDGQRGDREP